MLERMVALEGAMPAAVQQLETYADAAAADLDEAKRQRKRSANVARRDGVPNGAGQQHQPMTRVEQLAQVAARYQGSV